MSPRGKLVQQIDLQLGTLLLHNYLAITFFCLGLSDYVKGFFPMFHYVYPRLQSIETISDVTLYFTYHDLLAPARFTINLRPAGILL